MPQSAAPSGTNTFVPSMEASGNLWTGFSRNQEEFAVNRWTQIIRATKPQGLYAVWASKQAARVDPTKFEWADGAAAPNGNFNTESWVDESFRTRRYAIPFTLGNKAVDYADWPLLAAYGAIRAQQAMTLRSMMAVSCLEQVDWNSVGHLYNITGTGPGSGQTNANASWDTGTVDVPVIKKALGKGSRKINVDTMAVVQPKKLKLLINPNTAGAMANSAEIHGYIKQSEFAQAEMLGDVPNVNSDWGLPSRLYGLEVQVEDAVLNTTPKGLDNLQYVLPDNEAFLISRVGALEGVMNGPSYSTIVGFFLEEMTVESRVEPNERRTEGRVVDDFVYVCPNTVSGAHFTNLFANFSS